MKKQQICTNCHYAGTGKVPGSFLIELALWLFILPGFIYTCWRVSKKGKLCPKCKSQTMIPIDTPKGQDLLEKGRDISKGKLSLVCLSLLTLASCSATPAGKLTEEDFHSKTISVSYSADNAVRNFLDGLRYCGHETGTMFNVVHHGKPDCLPPASSGKITCDLYIDLGHAGNKYVSGRVIFEPKKRGTEITIGAINRFSKKDGMIEAWEKFIRGKEKEVCP